MMSTQATVVIDGRTYRTGSPEMVAALDRRNTNRRKTGERVLRRFAADHGIDYDSMTVADMADAAGWDDLR